jgi:transposase
MASVLHGSARTTPCVRAELQASKESTRSLAARYGLNPKTVKKWRNRTTTADAPMGPKAPKSTVLTPAEEAIVVAFRQKTLLPLDDVLGCLRDTIPNLSRSALHRCLQRHGISRPPKEETADKGYDADHLRRRLAERGAVAVIPSTASRRAPTPYDTLAYKDRNRVERMWCRLKDFRRVATCYDKLARNYLSSVLLAATCAYWIN